MSLKATEDREADDKRATADEANARFFRALGDPTRLAIVRLLLRRPHTVTELVHELGVGQSRVSNHLACLRWCLFVTSERRGREVLYSVSDQRLRRLLGVAGEIVSENEDHLANTGRTGPHWI
ncbi:MAG TPA: metalloregulator ArsR/SmtB family transcription factor [Streptosporangiaceae bacterium]